MTKIETCIFIYYLLQKVTHSRATIQNFIEKIKISIFRIHFSNKRTKNKNNTNNILLSILARQTRTSFFSVSCSSSELKSMLVMYFLINSLSGNQSLGSKDTLRNIS
jgi:hypothetical protein